MKGVTCLYYPLFFSPDFWMTTPPNDESELEPDLVRDRYVDNKYSMCRAFSSYTCTRVHTHTHAHMHRLLET